MIVDVQLAKGNIPIERGKVCLAKSSRSELGEVRSTGVNKSTGPKGAKKVEIKK